MNISNMIGEMKSSRNMSFGTRATTRNKRGSKDSQEYNYYNKLYYEGKPTGREYIAGSVMAGSMAEAKVKANKENNVWNRQSKKGNVKLTKVTKN